MGLKKYLPFERYSLETTLKPHEIRDRLHSRMAYSRLRTLNGDDTYEGKVTEERFKINRVIGYRNSFLPIIEGEIKLSGSLTQVDIKMRMHLFVNVFFGIWMSGVALVCLVMLLVALFPFPWQERSFNPSILIPFGMLVFGWSLAFFAFKFESRRSKKFLNELLQA